MGDRKETVLAICYDFDKTLSPTDMQAQGYIQSVGYDVDEFWEKTNALAQANEMDSNLAYMYVMMDEARGRLLFNREKLEEYGSRVQLFPGVDGWFDRINEYGKERNVKVEHYIISSGLKEIIEGSAIYKKFKEVYACEFMYDENDIACWPKNVVNYTTKTQFLFRINKGVSDLSDDRTLNDYVPEDERRIPFRNMIYIADGITDVPCMKLVKVNGGYSIAVYQKNKKTQANELLKDSRVNYIAKADYKKDSELDKLMQSVIAEIASKDKLIQLQIKQRKSV